MHPYMLARNLNKTGDDLAFFNSVAIGPRPGAVVGTGVALHRKPEGQGTLATLIVK